MEKPYRILHEGFDDVSLTFDPKPVVYRSDIQERIETLWEETKKKVTEKGGKLFRGPIAKVMSMRVEDRTLHADLKLTDYGAFIGTNSLPSEVTGFDPWNPTDTRNVAYPLSVGVVTVTADDFVIFGEKTKKNPYVGDTPMFTLAPEGYVNPVTDFGARLDETKEDEFGTRDGHAIGVSLQNAVLRELPGELNLHPFRPSHVVADCVINKHPMISFIARSPYKKDHVLSRWNAIGNKEYTALHFIGNTPSSIEAFLDEPVITKSSTAPRREFMAPHPRGNAEFYQAHFDDFN